jgi:plastocyanin
MLRIVASSLVALALAAAPAGIEVRGTLPEPGVVWIEDASHAVPLGETQMANTGKAFVPGVVVVAAGGSVRFPNTDPFFHSIYSESDAGPFDIGFYDTGPGKAVNFPRSGIVAVRCHIHGAMHGTIVVVGGPWAQTTQPGQSYAIEGVSPGRHLMHVWTPDGGEKITEIKI